jgi:hypothetical protein
MRSMGFTRIVACIAAAGLAVVLPAFGEDAVTWGPTGNGIRLGISFGPVSSEPELRIFIQNVGSTTQEILIGSQVGNGTAVDLKFVATAQDGKEREGFEINSFIPIAGLVLPAVIRLVPGATHELRFPLKKIICVERPGDVTFEALVQQRSSVRVSLETDARSARWAGLSSPWIGKVTSGELSPMPIR